MNGEREGLFLRSFNINDRSTVRAVEKEFLPALRRELDDLMAINERCIASGRGACVADWIDEVKTKISAVESRLALSPHTSRPEVLHA